MAVSRTKVDVSEERRVLSHMITSTEVLTRLKGIGEARLFESGFARTIATWCWEFFEIASAAPGKAMEEIYHRKAPELSEEDREMVAEFLSSLSADWERAAPSNSDYAFDAALSYFKIRALVRLKEQVESAITDRNPSQGEKVVAEYTRPERKGGEAVDMFNEVALIQDAFGSEEERLFRFPGDLGRVMGQFLREDFVAFLAPPKRGKTWWMMAVAQAAALTGLKVLFISLEMSQRQMIRRFWQMLQGSSQYGESAPWPEFEADGDKFRIIHGERETRRVRATEKEIQDLQKDLRKSARGGELRLENYPTGALSLRDLKTRLSNLSLYENFNPDLIVLDYADIMDHGPGNDERHRINRTWMGLRGLASELKACVFTASQSGRKTVSGKKDADEDDIAEDIRKLAHVTKLIKINQNREEKQQGIYRISCDTMREGAGVGDTAIVTSCLAIGRPWLDSRLKSRVLTDAD